MYTVTIAARIKIGWFFNEDWNACAVPAKARLDRRRKSDLPLGPLPTAWLPRLPTRRSEPRLKTTA